MERGVSEWLFPETKESKRKTFFLPLIFTIFAPFFGHFFAPLFRRFWHEDPIFSFLSFFRLFVFRSFRAKRRRRWNSFFCVSKNRPREKIQKAKMRFKFSFSFRLPAKIAVRTVWPDFTKFRHLGMHRLWPFCVGSLGIWQNYDLCSLTRFAKFRHLCTGQRIPNTLLREVVLLYSCTSCLTGLDSADLLISKFDTDLLIWPNPNQSNRRSAVLWYFPSAQTLAILIGFT